MKNLRIVFLSSLCFCFLSQNVQAQLDWLFGSAEKTLAREGNSAYAEGDFLDAELKYKQSIRSNEEGDLEPLAFNLGGALFQQGEERYGEAVEQYNQALNQLKDKSDRADAFYNMGNAQLHLGDLEDAIESYKEALKLKPTDEQAKYNLAYAQWLASQESSSDSQCNNPQQSDDPSQEQKEEKEQQQQEQQDQEQQEQQEQEQSEEEKEEQEQQDQEQQDQEQQEGEQEKQEEGEEKEKEEQEQKEGESSENEEEQKEQEEEETEGEDGEAKPGEEMDEKPDSTEMRPVARAMTREEVDKILDRLKKEELEVQEKLLKKRTTGTTKSGKDW